MWLPPQLPWPAAATLMALLLAASTAAAASIGTEEGPASNLHIILLKSQPAATYSGGVAGMAATAASGGRRFSASSAAVQRYTAYLKQQSNAVATKALGGTDKIAAFYSITVAGFAAGPLTASQVAALRTDRRVLGVFANRAVRTNTLSTPSFLGLDTPGGTWSKLGGSSNAGEDIVVGIIDTGFWAEANSFSDRADPSSNSGEVVYGPVPPSFKGSCPGEDSPCNRKLIGCRYFGSSWPQGNPQSQFPEELLSCRTPYTESHGTHVASTAAGNAGVTVNATTPVTISGMAPRARISLYKIFWGPADSAYDADIISAVDASVADGCHVINLSLGRPVSQGEAIFLDPVAQAYLGAAAAGVSVVAAAGNSGPDLGSMESNVGPWLTTVAANTHSRKELANLTLGDGRIFAGIVAGFWQYSPLGSSPFVDAEGVGLPGQNNSRLCLNGTLDASKVTGKIVLCTGGSIAFNDKGAAVALAGGVGMIIVAAAGREAMAIDLVGDSPIPTLYIASAEDRAALKAYASSAGAVASMSEFKMSFDATAPRVAVFSSRGPVVNEPDLLKPDISGPGVAIVAPSSAKLPLWQISGTSMSSPHLAGVTALVRQAHPDWSPMAVKSAIMTTAYQTTKTGPSPGTLLDSTTPLSVGAGFVDTTAALNPGLVFDSGNADWKRFLCGTGELGAADVAQMCPECASDPSLCEPANLNTPSILIAQLAGVRTVRRTVKSVLPTRADFTISSLEKPPGFDVSVSPASFSLDPGASQALSITFTRMDAKYRDYRFGAITWSSSEGTTTRIPLAVAAGVLSAPKEVKLATPQRSRNLTYLVTPGWTGRFSSLAVGLQPARVLTGTVVQNPAVIFDWNNPANGTTAFKVSVPAGSQWNYLRVATYSTDLPAGTDLDLIVFDAAGKYVASSGSSTATETVDIPNAKGSYTVYANGFNVPTGQTEVKLHVWMLRMPSPGSSNARASPDAGSPVAVTLGTAVPVSVAFNARLMSPAQRWMGMVLYSGDEALVNDYKLITLISLV